jgi:CRISPR/Cas system-associated exonuclease Cas4 (RecB family)
VDSLVLYHVPSQTPFEVERHPPERVEELRQTVREVVRGIEDERFEPDTGHYCQWCDFQPHCPAYADEYPENWPEAEEEPVPSAEEVARLADRYGELKERKSELDSELEEVRGAREQYYKGTGKRAAAGGS